MMNNSLLAALNQAQQTENVDMNVVETGDDVNLPSDNPSDAALYSLSQAQNSSVTQYLQNITTLTGQMQTAGSALQSTVTLLTQAVTLGVQGASDTGNNDSALATEVSQMQQQLLSLANTQFQGNYIFGPGSTGAAFTDNGDTVTYNGSESVNQVEIAPGTNVDSNIPGDQIFLNSNGNAFQALSDLQSALQSGNTSGASAAVTELQNALNVVSQQQEIYGARQSDLGTTQTYLNNEADEIQQQQNQLIGANMADAITNLSNSQDSLQAVISAGSRLGQINLLTAESALPAVG